MKHEYIPENNKNKKKGKNKFSSNLPSSKNNSTHEKNRESRKKEINALSTQMDDDKWDMACCEKVLILVSMLGAKRDLGDQPDKNSSVKDKPGKVSSQNLSRHIDNHFSKGKASARGALIDRRQFLQLVLAAESGTYASQATRDETQHLLRLLRGLLVVQPDKCYSALLSGATVHNPMAHLSLERAFRQPQEQGRAFNKLTLLQKGLWTVNSLIAVGDTNPLSSNNDLGDDANNNSGEDAKTGLHDEMPDIHMAGEASDAPVHTSADSTVEEPETSGTYNAAGNSLVVGAAATMIGGPITGIVAASLAYLPSGVESAFSYFAYIKSKSNLDNLYQDLDDRVNLNILLPINELVYDVMQEACRIKGMKGDIRKQLENTKFYVTLRTVINVDKRTGKRNYLRDHKNARITTTPYKMATGQYIKDLEPYLGVLRANSGSSDTIHWTGNFKNSAVQDFLKDGSVVKYVNRRLSNLFSDENNLQNLKKSIRFNAEFNMFKTNITAKDEQKRRQLLTSEDFDNVRQVKSLGTIIPSLFEVRGMIYSFDPSFSPVKFEDVKHDISKSPEFFDQVKMGLTESERSQRDSLLRTKGVAFSTFKAKYKIIKAFLSGFPETPTLSLGASGKVEDITIDKMVKNYKEEFDLQTYSNSEQSLFQLAAVADIIFKFLPIAAPALGMSLAVNIGLGILSSSTEFIRAAATDDPVKVRSYVKSGLMNIFIQIMAGVSATVKIMPLKLPKLNSLEKMVHETTTLMLNTPNARKLIFKSFILRSLPYSEGAIRTSHTLAETLGLLKGQMNLTVRVTGGWGKLFIEAIEELIFEERNSNSNLSDLNEQALSESILIREEDSPNPKFHSKSQSVNN